MSDVVILHWERRRLRGMIVRPEGSSLRIVQDFSHAWPDDFDPIRSPGQAAAQIRGRLTEQLSSSQRVIVALSREDVILRHLDVPDVSDDELPELVRYQAAARSTLPIDQLLLDFLPLPKQPGQEGRPVLAITVPKSLTQGIQAVLDEAGLEPSEITFSSVGLAEYTARAHRQRGQPGEHAVLGLCHDGSHVELVVLSNSRLVYAHAAKLASDDIASNVSGLLAEASRTLVAAQRVSPQLKIQHAYISWQGEIPAELVSSLSERLGAPVEPIRVQELSATGVVVGRTSSGGGPSPSMLGLALAELNRITPAFDFLHPRQPPPKINLRKLQLAVGTAAALLIGVLIFGGIEWMRSSLQRQIQALINEENDLDFKVKPGLAVLNAASLIDQWQAGNLQQIQQMSALERLMEGTDRMYLSQYAFTVGQGESLGNVQAFGNAKSRDDITEFQQRLKDTKSYLIQPRQIAHSSNDDEYPHRFELHADLFPKPKSVAAAPNPQPSTLNP